jgi:hypothetical protein
MPTTIETISNAALERTLAYAENVRSLPWADGLSQLEQFITAKNPTSVPREAKRIANAIAESSGFMIALVFDKTHTKAVALPLREVYGGYARTELGVDRFDRPADLTDIRTYVHAALDMQSEASAQWKKLDVVLIEQNLGRHRIALPITIASLNNQTDYPQKDQYMEWIKRTQDELNSTRST